MLKATGHEPRIYFVVVTVHLPPQRDNFLERGETNMPRRDGTGPMRMGPKTGRGAGFCGGNGAAGFMNRSAGLGGFGRCRGGRGNGYGRRNMFHATGLTGRQRAAMGTQSTGAGVDADITKNQEIEALKQQDDDAAQVLENIRKRIGELEGSSQAAQ
jgi:hypothetical protein